MRVLEKKEATAPLAAYTTWVKKEPVIVTRNGKPIAALVSIENADLETVSLSTNRKFLELIERSRARQRAEGGISSKEMRRRLGLKRREKA
jgi:antitoxin (DNA-binding transcriptional repressor) of toxin-antitoxin stability system